MHSQIEFCKSQLEHSNELMKKRNISIENGNIQKAIDMLNQLNEKIEKTYQGILEIENSRNEISKKYGSIYLKLDKTKTELIRCNQMIEELNDQNKKYERIFKEG